MSKHLLLFQKSTFGLFLLTLLLTWVGWQFSREQFPSLIIALSFSYVIYWWLLAVKPSLQQVLFVGFLVRLLLVFAEPQLSNDVFRFIWDGRLLAAGKNPFALRPSEWMAQATPPKGINPQLHQLIYADNYTIYPPIHQAIFYLSARFSSGIWGSVMILKSLLLLGEVGMLVYLYRHRKWFGPLAILMYALNPLVILEVVGNAHFEGLMTFFLVMGLVSLRKKQIGLAGFGFGLAIATKLLPLMILPIILRYLVKKDWLLFFGMILLVNMFLWAPLLLIGSIGHIFDSIWLYFESFEFNASIYYLAKYLLPAGWRIGLMTNGLTILLIMVLAFRQKIGNEKQLFRYIFMAWLVYLLNAAIVHPWYIIPLIGLGSFVKTRAALVWSGLVLLSYSHYWGGEMMEKPIFLLLEYGLLFLFVAWENLERDYWINNQIIKKSSNHQIK